MDNLINVIVAFIIIYSFLAPLFKQNKNKGQQEKRKGPQNPNGKNRPSYKGMDYDIFTEIDEMINKQRRPMPEQMKPMPRTRTVRQDSDEHAVTQSEHIQEFQTEPKLSSQKMLRYSDEEKKSFETNLEKQFIHTKEVYFNPTLYRVRSAFSNKTDFRTGFIISEILGKPKALRR